MKIDKRLFKQLKQVKKDFYLSIFFSLIGGFFIVFQAWYLSKLLNNAFLKKETLHNLLPIIILLVTIIILRAVSVWLSEGFAGKTADKIKFILRKKLLNHIAQLGPIEANYEQTGELANTAINGIEDLDAYFSQYIPQLFITAMIPFTILFFIFPTDTLSGIIMILTAPTIPVLMTLIGNAAEKKTKQQWKALSRMSAYFLDTLQGIKILKILGRSKDQIKTIAEISNKFRLSTMSVLKIAFISALVLELIATLSTAIIAVEIGLRLLYGRIDFLMAFFVLVLAPEFYMPFRQLGLRFHAGMSGVAAADRIFKILGMPILSTQNKKIEIKELTNYTIEFKDVSFAYREKEKTTISNLSFLIEQNKKTALVGPSGAGKSTIVNLLLKFITPTNGKILVNNIDLQQIEVKQWRNLVSWVPQTPYLFNTTIRENIKIANPQASDKEIIMALKEANAYNFVMEMPQKLDTLVGERAIKMSGGQAQRIAIARAFVKDAPIIILDEASSNLDPQVENQIQEAIEKLTKNKTVLVIAHRLSTIINSDKIVVITNGKIVEQGTHNNLLNNKGFYSKLISSAQNTK